MTVPATQEATLHAAGLDVGYGDRTVLRGVSVHANHGDVLGILGESGSGKSTLLHALAGTLPDGAWVRAHELDVAGLNPATATPLARRTFWHERLAVVPQNPSVSLNPTMRVGRQLAEALNPGNPARAETGRLDDMLRQVGLDDPARVRRAFPFELSGGQQQRVMIAMALVREPSILMLDEPTTNLDVTTEAAILNLVRERVEGRRMTTLFVSHNLAVLAHVANRLMVLYEGACVEAGHVDAVVKRPRHPYTRMLMASVPRMGARAEALPYHPPASGDHEPAACAFAPRCPHATDVCFTQEPPEVQDAGGRTVACHHASDLPEFVLPTVNATEPADVSTEEDACRLTNVTFRYRSRGTQAGPSRPAVSNVSMRLKPGRTLGLVGESGSGKSTLAKAVMGLNPPQEGVVHLAGEPLPLRLEDRSAAQRARVQMVFQSSDASLNPYRTVGAILTRVLHRARQAGVKDVPTLDALLDAVQLPLDYRERLSADLSGGEKQRVAIARAVAMRPDVIVFDESFSGLDVTIQAGMLALMKRIRDTFRATFLFISHDLAVVSDVADDVAVMYQGELVEVGPLERVMSPPFHPYTRLLLGSVPRLESPPIAPLQEPAVAVPATGCPFQPRCALAIPGTCDTTMPPLLEGTEGHRLACHADRSALNEPLGDG